MVNYYVAITYETGSGKQLFGPFIDGPGRKMAVASIRRHNRGDAILLKEVDHADALAHGYPGITEAEVHGD